MRLQQIVTYYDVYLGTFHRAAPDVAALPYDRQLDRLLADGFSAGHVLAPYFRPLGFETEFVVANWVSGQGQWARERGIEPPADPEAAMRLCVERVDRFRPDILLISDPIGLDARFLRSLAHRPRLVMAWRQASIPDGTDWRGFDILLSGDDGCLRRAQELGARRTVRFRPGFPRWIAEMLADEPRRNDVVFCGQISREHRERANGLARVAEAAERSGAGFGTDFHLLGDAEGILARHNRGALWGMAMYRAIRHGRIGLNVHIDITGRAMNIRMQETTGLGTMLLTEADPSLGEQFVPGREVETYASAGELTEKIRYFLDHPDKREAIARRGQERCLRDWSMESRVTELADLIRGAI
ncbi:glycosyltransferase [Azospirillum halopraeferens]|uniref:glycosyltransferase family protein n=1 Tax=Azospirillum halopraeferens TaxID=34010 RepID=UPI0004116937|nr:glycosyltransferase [Azospirillum halopraeferens]